MTTEAPFEATERLVYIEVSRIQPNRFQPRKTFNEKELEELAESIDMHGLLQPIIVRHIDDAHGGIEYEIVAGERRWRAHKLLQKARIKAILKDELPDEESAEAALIENLQREDLNPIEEATSIVQLQKRLGLTQEQLAQRLGKSRAYISQVVRLVRLPEDVQELLRSGQLGAWHGTILAAAPAEMQSALAARAVKGQWNIEALRRHVATAKAQGGGPRRNTRDRLKRVVSGNIMLIEAASAKALDALAAVISRNGDITIWRGRREIAAALGDLEQEPLEESTKRTEGWI